VKALDFSFKLSKASVRRHVVFRHHEHGPGFSHDFRIAGKKTAP